MSKNPDFTKVSEAARKDILELQTNIEAFKKGQYPEERFRHYRLTRGVYGQRQQGVQMFRTKIPFGRLTADQLITIADTSEKYATGNLHLTTRQNIQYHYVKLEDSPAVWTALAAAGVTAREACGNTVRNLTASAKAGIDPDELFDVSPYVQASFEYFLRNPICQDMGRKIKPAFSSSDKDSAFTYFHDFGFIPRIKFENGEKIRGFKVVVGGGLGAQSMVAKTAYEFLHEDEIISFMEAGIRVFDRYGERKTRMKARLKFLIKKIGFETFMDLVNLEKKALKNQKVKIDRNLVTQPEPPKKIEEPLLSKADLANPEKYQRWLETNVFEQKQKGFYGVQLRVKLGDIHATNARTLAALVKKYAADDIRITVNQGLLLKYVRLETLPALFNELDKIDLANPGFDSLADVTSCPGTDTCALGVANSTGLATRLEEVVREEYPHLISESNIKIKISGCMNSCGQHMAAQIGFHGSSIKKKAFVLPAMQVVLGGGVSPEGEGFVAERVIKVPTKQVPNVLRTLLNDYEDNANEGEYFNDYYYRLGKKYFYNLIKPLSDTSSDNPDWHFDWGQDRKYIQNIGVGECAGVAYDMVGAIVNDARERLEWAKNALETERWADSIYHSYSTLVIGAKSLLLAKDVVCNTHKGIISDFQTEYVEQGDFDLNGENFNDKVLKINKKEPSEIFAFSYYKEAKAFFEAVLETRKKQLADSKEDMLVVENYYRA